MRSIKATELKRVQCPFEIKAAKKGDNTVEFTGLASVYDVVDLGGDVVRPGAFTKTIAERPEVIMLWQHDSWTPIGKGLLSDEPKLGLKIEGTIETDLTAGRDAGLLVMKSLVRGLSIGYRTMKDSFIQGGRVRELLEVMVWEVSLATFPMNPAAQIVSAKDFDPNDDSWIARTAEEVKAGRILDIQELAQLSSTLAARSESAKTLSALYDTAKAAADKAAGKTEEPAAGHSDADQFRAAMKGIF